ncbi:MAG: type III polyketide synthase [Candidatus Cyclonatronum sp.]|uniref:type III polyketide synthase n=1 Tax=Cyclonatronum sp. TaxID=3024185 RepID=UPI0025BE6544|nr:type III polyketide synthase [Cyclonatronum sp.]MCH8487310.1 type III polyketide synthase [Cyclonatronum sp.]
MPAYIHQIETDVPANSYTQEFAREFMKQHVADRDAVKRILHRVYALSGIDKRHSVITEFASGESGDFFDAETQTFLNPGTAARNDRYTREAKELFVRLARKTVEASDFETSDITHVVTASCTGFFAPGPEYFIVRGLGLPPSTRRYHIGFMGCYAAFPALKLAETITAEDPDAVVLIVCLELCTLHLQPKTDTDALLSAAVFGDGAGAAIVSRREPAAGKPALRMDGMFTALTPQGEQDMAWTIGDNGFDMVLSTYIPDIIQSNIGSLLAPILGDKTEADQFGYWAIHPGGRAILDKIAQSLSLEPEQLGPSRQVLSEYGNMSSATILFVLKSLLYDFPALNKPVISMAFGPGLTVETGLFTPLNQPEPAAEISASTDAALPQKP